MTSNGSNSSSTSSPCSHSASSSSRSSSSDKRLSFAEKTHKSNVCLKTDDGTLFWTRRELLQARSPFFKAMLGSGWSEKSSITEGKPVIIREIPSDVFRTLLHFIHTNEAIWPCSTESEFFFQFTMLSHYAHYFGFSEDLEFSAAVLMKGLINKYSVFKIWEMAQAHSASVLSETCEIFLTKNFREACETNDFLLSDRELLRRVLQKGDIECSPEKVFDSLEIWAKFTMRAQNIPGNDVRGFLMDLLPPQTLFTKSVKQHVLTFNPRLFY